MNAGPDQTVTCTNNCATLTATSPAGAQTTSYTVQQIPYNPYSYTTGTPILVNIDDIWSAVLPMPFNFCFYGNVYNSCIVGANGAISFNTANANLYNTWPIGAAIPSAAPADMRNCIMAPWHDIDPSVFQSGQTSDVRWQVLGTAPCRTFVVSWYNIPMFGSSCNQNTSLNATQQIVLYETTNIIETYIQNKRVCASWNSGRAIHGIQNAAGTVATVVPGRNFPTQWNATNDAWRFVPAGASNLVTQWFQVGNPIAIATGTSTLVCPPTTTTYYAQATYTNCDNSTVTVRDTVTVNLANAIQSVASNIVQPTCSINGSITLTPSGGTPGYTYTWSPNVSSTNSASNLPAGTYNITVTDAAGCPFPTTVTLNQPQRPTANISASTNPPCFGAANGSATVSVSGGTPGYSYSWNTVPVQTTSTATGLGPGTYSVIVTDANGCRDTTSVTITQPTQVTVTNSPTQPTCGVNNGAITLNPSGGTPGYTYTWSPNVSSTNSASNLASGTYNITITDAVGCTATQSVTLNASSRPTVNISAQSNPTCFGSTNGSATAASVNGTPGYTYTWNTVPVQNTPTATGLGQGTYQVIVVDALGCRDTTTVTLTQPTQLTVSASLQQPTCGGANGSISLNPGGGTPNYNYTWSPAQGNVVSASNLAAGTYNITVTDANGCTTTQSSTLNPSTRPTASISATIPASCFGSADGEATVSAVSGTPGYTYSWSTVPVQNTATATGLSAGSYSVTVTDILGCTDTVTALINQPNPIITNTSQVQVTCPGGSDGCAIVSASGGPSGVFTYLWSNGGTNDTICGLAAGTYYVTVTDTTGGGGTSIVNVYSETFDPAGAWTLNVATGPNGADNNFWVINDNEGGVLPPGCGVASNGNNSLHITSVFCPTCGAAYDAGGLCGILFCPETNRRAESPVINTTGFSNLTLSFDFISMGDGLLDNASVWYNDGLGWALLAPSIKSVNCISGQGQWTATSFALPASCNNNPNVRVGFNWTNNDDGAGTDPSVAINNVLVTSSVTTTGGASCTMVDSIVVTQPQPIAIATTSTNSFCQQPNGSATATATGGNGTFTYQWNTTPVQNTATATGLAPGTYTVTATDFRGCTQTTTVTISDNPGPSISMGQVTNAACFGTATGSASASSSGGTAPVTITWGTVPSQSGPTATGLPAGSYQVWATDSAGCTDTTSFTIAQPSPLTVSLSTTGAICNLANGSATATPSGGTAPYTYLWSNGQTTQTATNLPGGNTGVTVTDFNGCTITGSANITQAGEPTINLVGFNDVTCFGGNNGAITVSASGGTPGYTYSWTNGQTTPTATGLVAGTYSVTVTDQNGCRDALTQTISQPTQLTGVVTPTPNGCATSNPTGTIGVVASGGTPPYSYSWNTVPVSNGPYVSGLLPGTYTVTISDANGCLSVQSGTVVQIPNPVVTAGPDASFCEGEGGVQISAVASSGTPGYFYNWWCANPPCGLSSPFDDNPMANPTATQWYYVQVTDTNGCMSDVDSLLVTVLPKPIVDAGPDIILCGDEAPCEILMPSISGAPGPYVFNWTPGTGLNDSTIMNPCARPDTTTIYALVVTAGNGCTSDFTTTDTLATVTVHVNPVPIADAGPDRDICYGDTTQLQGTGTGAGPDYDFEWTPTTHLNDSSLTSPLAFPPLTTTYTLVVWSNGCPSYGDSVVVNVHTLPTIDAGWDREICPGMDTLIDAQAGGDSTATYTYQWWPTPPIVGSPNVEDPTVAPTQTTVFYVQATSSFGCNSLVDSILITVLPAPQAEAGPNLLLCNADTVQLQGGYWYTTPDSANIGEFYYSWTPGGSLSDTTAEDPLAWPAATTVYTLEIRYLNCSSTDSVIVTVGAPVLAQATPDTTVICARDSVQIDASGTLAADIEWIPSTGLSDPGSLTPMASPGTTTTYTLVALNGGCTDSTEFTIEVLPRPEATFINSFAEGCAPLTVSFMDVSSGATALAWNFGDGSPVDNNAQPTHVFAQPGDYAVTLWAAAPGGCTDVSAPATIHVGAPPVAAFSSDPDFPTVLNLPNTLVSFTDNSQGAIQWTWDFADGNMSALQNPAHTFSVPGEYFVTLRVTSAEGCSDDVTHGPYIVTVPDLLIPNVFSPNGDGVNDEFQILYTGDQPFTCAVFDRWGVLLWETVNKTATWSGKNGDGVDVSEGVYFYVVKIGGRDFNGNVTLMR